MKSKNIYLPFHKLSIKHIGSKAFNLGLLFDNGYKIPRSAFLSVTIQRKLFRFHGITDKIEKLNKIPSGGLESYLLQLRDLIISIDIAGTLQSELSELVARWHEAGVTSLAVRSSAISEDLEGQSFAGQYDTVLNVDPGWQMIDAAIKKVWASEWSLAAVTYKKENSLPLKNFGMGVIIQEQVAANYAGVLFSQDPQGLSDDGIIEYVEGLGESLVSGEKTPVQLKFSRTENKFIAVGELEPGIKTHFKNLVESSIQLERFFNKPVDVEWAIKKNRLYFLQIRPITTIDQSILWTDENVGEVIPDVVTPYSWSILKPITNGAFNELLKNLGIYDYPRGGLFGLYRGKVYFNNTAFNKTLKRFYISEYLSGAKNLKGIFSLIGNSLFILRSLLNIAFYSLRLPAKIRRYLKEYPHALSEISMNPEDDVSIVPDKIQRIVAGHRQTMALHIACSIYAELTYQFLDKACSLFFSEDHKISADSLLRGFNEAESARSGFALWELSRSIAKDDAVCKIFTEYESQEIPEVLARTEAGKQILTEIAAFTDAFGHGALHEFELFYPRWWEDSRFIYSNLKNYLKSDSQFNPVAEARKIAESRALKMKSAADELSGLKHIVKRFIFNFFFKRARFFSIQRENLKQAFIKGHSELKKHLRFLGESLKSKGNIDEVLDILFLEEAEIVRSFGGPQVGEGLKTDIRKRREQRKLFQDGGHPARLKQIVDRWIPFADSSDSADGDLAGIGCSSGIIEGNVKIILEADSFAELEPGEILVTRSTNPGWTPLFIIASAVVTEIGGALSHGAIIAREYGLPMVAAVAGATQKLTTGQRIRVNGHSGIIEILADSEI